MGKIGWVRTFKHINNYNTTILNYQLELGRSHFNPQYIIGYEVMLPKGC